MTRNEYIAECAWERAMQLPNTDHIYKEAINFAVTVANALEAAGCAPWQDTPPGFSHSNQNKTMTRNEAIWDATLIYAKLAYVKPLAEAVALIEDMEGRGCAPWQDAPAQTVTARNEPLTFALHERDTQPRKEITAADVQPGAIFTSQGGVITKIVDREGGLISAQKGSGALFIAHVAGFVTEYNSNNATVTPPAQSTNP